MLGPKVVYFARMSNSILLGMGGYCFGFEVGEHVNAHPMIVGFMCSILFLLNSIYVRRKCEEAGYPR